MRHHDLRTKRGSATPEHPRDFGREEKNEKHKAQGRLMICDRKFENCRKIRISIVKSATFCCPWCMNARIAKDSYRDRYLLGVCGRREQLVVQYRQHPTQQAIHVEARRTKNEEIVLLPSDIQDED